MIDNPFLTNKLNEFGIRKVAETRRSFTVLLENLDKLVPYGTKQWYRMVNNLEDACFQAIKGISQDPENIEEYGK